MASRPAPPRASSAPRSGGGGFALLTPAFLDELRHRTRLSALVGRKVRLSKAGNEWKAPCPFHNEKTPSFYVNDDKAFYHCFGCSAHGDAIRWLTEAEGLPFIDAVKQLADAAGMDMPKAAPEEAARIERRRTLSDVVGEAAAWFAGQLDGPGGASARAYLDRRGVTVAARRKFGLGWSPDGRHNLGHALKDVEAPALVETGLLIQPDGGGDAYDRFRGRLMVPIHDRRGQPIAFGGRIIGDGEPKYLNSPETPLFDKGRTLFNLHRAIPPARKAGRLLVVEGYLDVIALDGAGIEEVVAPLGTALTEAQMELLWGLVDVPILCFDGDGAGRRAALRAAVRALPALRPGKSLAFAMLPPGKDPDDVVREGGGAAMEALLGQVVPLDVLLYAAERDAADMSRPEKRAELRQKLDDFAGGIADRIVAEEYRRSLRSLFYEEFGLKKGERKAIAAAIVRTGERGRINLLPLFVRSALYGLSRFPQLIADHGECLAALRIDHPSLLRWREALLRIGSEPREIDGDGVEAILEADGLPEVLRTNLRIDLRFPCDRGDEQVQRAAIIGLLETLVDERDIADGLSNLSEAAVADAGGDRYLAIETARQRLREQRCTVRERAYELGAGGEI